MSLTISMSVPWSGPLPQCRGRSTPRNFYLYSFQFSGILYNSFKCLWFLYLHSMPRHSLTTLLWSPAITTNRFISPVKSIIILKQNINIYAHPKNYELSFVILLNIFLDYLLNYYSQNQLILKLSSNKRESLAINWHIFLLF